MGRPGLVRTGVSQNSAHKFDSKCIYVLCCLLVKDCPSKHYTLTQCWPNVGPALGQCIVFVGVSVPLTSCSKGFFLNKLWKSKNNFSFSGVKSIAQDVILLNVCHWTWQFLWARWGEIIPLRGFCRGGGGRGLGFRSDLRGTADKHFLHHIYDLISVRWLIFMGFLLTQALRLLDIVRLKADQSKLFYPLI